MDPNQRTGFAANALSSPSPTRKNWDNSDTPTDIPLHDALSSPHVQFASRQPSIIPSPVYANSPASSSAPFPPPPTPMHTLSTTNQFESRAKQSTNFGSDTFRPDLGGEKHAVDTDESNMGYAMYQRNQEPTYYGNAGVRSDGFMRLESTDAEAAKAGGGTGTGLGGDRRGLYDPPQMPPPGAPPPRNAPYMPYPQPNNRRSLGLQLLLGPIRRPVFTWLSGLAMLVILVVEIVKNWQLTGSVIQTSPNFNPMIGPSTPVLINMGARFTPCIRPLPNYSASSPFPYCYRAGETCTIEDLCGFGGFGSDDVPNQSFRFITPIFLHAGVVHYVINMLCHLRLGADLECLLGTPRYVLLYFAAGIWGFVLSSTLSQATSASMGCSGALFGLIGYMFVDITVNWKDTLNPGRELMKLLIVTIISLVIGLLPGLDNFAHLGGFVVGLIMGALIAPTREAVSRRGKIVTWGIRAAALVALIVLFAVTISQFYSAPDPTQICPNCKYLSCLPVNNWCDL